MGRRRKRRLGVTDHPGVTLLRPSRSRRYWVLRWQDQEGTEHQRSTGFETESLARKKAVEISRRLQLTESECIDLTWHRFCQRYEQEHLALSSRRNLTAWRTACNYYTNLMRPQFVSEVTTSSVSRFTARLRTELESRNGTARETSIASYLRQLAAGLNWATRLGLLEKVDILIPRRARGKSKLMRSRPITREEYERILLAVPKVRPRDSGQWERILQGFWESGLRLGELVVLSWDSGPLQMDFVQGIPFIRILAEGQKRYEDQFQPVTPQFWDLLKDTPRGARTGCVFPMVGKEGKALSAHWIGAVIGRIGARAGVRTGLDTSKTATSHDIGRRSMTTRLVPRLSEGELADFMRHASPQTTRQYYRVPDLLALASKVGWSISGQQGDT